MLRPSYCTFLATLCVAILVGCGGSSSSVAPAAPAPAAAPLVFEPATALAITKGSIQHVSLALGSASATSGTTTRTVRVTTSNTAVADVFPETCTLANVSTQSARCLLTVTGKADGTTTLLATADGIAPVQIPAAVSTTINYGQLAVESSGTYSSGPATLTFANNGSTPFSLPIKARMVGSSGVDAASSVVISFAGAGVTFNPAQCTVTTLAPECKTVASLPQAAATAITVSAAGSSYSGYTPVPVTANPAAPSTNGTIAISTQSGNNVPNGMKAPLFVNWTNAALNDTVNLTLTLQGTGISFYSFTPGNNTAPVLSQTQTCTLVYAGAGAATNVLNCGLGLVGAAVGSTVVVNAAMTSSSGQTYTLGSLVLGAIAPAAAIRTVTFTNNSTQTIYVGITGGAAAAYLDSATPALPPGQTTANMKAGAASLCGPSNPQAACPLGTTCMQGGASPNSNIGNTPYYCYYDAPAPSNGYPVAASGSTSISISGSSIAPNGVIWSGNFYPRSGCDPTTGVCDNATCRGAAGGLVCGPGTGPSPGINTLAELTFQASPQPDFYDVSIINGANFATQFGPTNVSISSTNSYMCGTAGSTAAQNGGYSVGGIGLPAAPWTMTPSAQSFPSGAVTSGDASSYFRVVIPTTTPVTTCTMNSGCTDPVNNTCGYAMSDVTKGGFTFATRSCGRPVAWASANAIWGANQTSANVAPFSFTTDWPNGLTGSGSGTVSVGDLQLCINQTFSSYIANGTAANPVQPAALACGGVMWGATQNPLPIANPMSNVGLGLTTPSTPAYTANAHWLDYVLPTITWMKTACPTCYTYPFDDMSSTFTCANATASAATNYGVTFSDLK